MAFIRMITRGNGKKAVEVFIKGEELLKTLKRQGVYTPTASLPALNPNEQYCLTFTHNELEEYDN